MAATATKDHVYRSLPTLLGLSFTEFETYFFLLDCPDLLIFIRLFWQERPFLELREEGNNHSQVNLMVPRHES